MMNSFQLLTTYIGTAYSKLMNFLTYNYTIIVYCRLVVHTDAVIDTRAQTYVDLLRKL